MTEADPDAKRNASGYEEGGQSVTASSAPQRGIAGQWNDYTLTTRSSAARSGIIKVEP